MTDTYLTSCLRQSAVLTKTYSTSFSSSLSIVDRGLQPAIYAIYGMVRLADEIVDTPIKGVDPSKELAHFKRELDTALSLAYSTNPILHAFQWAFHTYGLRYEWVDAFFYSMALDLSPQRYDQELYETYIYGSAEAVGLMCLAVFSHDDPTRIKSLIPGAKRLGAAYQKINFLRDIGDDFHTIGRCYFPGVTPGHLELHEKDRIEKEIEEDFYHARTYIAQLPHTSRRGVFLSYLYFLTLLQAVKQVSPDQLLAKRIRVSNQKKPFCIVEPLLVDDIVRRNIYFITSL